MAASATVGLVVEEPRLCAAVRKLQERFVRGEDRCLDVGGGLFFPLLRLRCSEAAAACGVSASVGSLPPFKVCANDLVVAAAGAKGSPQWTVCLRMVAEPRGALALLATVLELGLEAHATDAGRVGTTSLLCVAQCKDLVSASPHAERYLADVFQADARKKRALIAKQWTQEIEFTVLSLTVTGTTTQTFSLTAERPAEEGPSCTPAVDAVAVSPPGWTHTPVYQYAPDEGSWVELGRDVHSPVAEGRNGLHVVAINSLFDTHLPEKLHTAKRRAMLIEELQRLDADIVVIEEVLPGLLDVLQANYWIRATYAMSERSDVATTVTPYGQLILCRHSLPMLAFRYSFTRWKQVVLASVVLNGRLLVIVGVHLTSDHRDNKAYRRSVQLDTLRRMLFDNEHLSDPKLPLDVIVAGDFNFGDDNQFNHVPEDFIDVWPALKGSEPGFTYDPRTNWLARLISATQFQRRLDRITVHQAAAWRPTTIELVGTRPSTGEPTGDGTLFISDHYGLSCTFQFDETALTKKTTPFVLCRPAELVVLTDKMLEACSRTSLSAAWAATTADAVEALYAILPKALPENVGSEWCLQIFGSSLIGTPEPGSDVDCVLIAKVPRSDVFPMAVRDALKDDPRVPWVYVIDDAKIPIVSFELLGCHFELQYAWLRGSVGEAAVLQAGVPFDALAAVPQKLLCTQDHRTVPTLHGLRDAQALLELVPNHALFKQANAAVRRWAKRRGLYSAKFGFLGGYMWNILLANVLLTNSALATWQSVLCTFFATYDTWPWNKKPIALVPMSAKIGRVLMPIANVTPPRQFIVRNVKLATYMLLCDEFHRAARLLAQPADPCAWAELFEPFDFFAADALYVEVVASSNSFEEFQEWQGYVASRIIRCVEKLGDEGIWARPACHQWPRVSQHALFGSAFYMQLKLAASSLDQAYQTVVPVVQVALEGWSRQSETTLLHVSVLPRDAIPAEVLADPAPSLAHAFSMFAATVGDDEPEPRFGSNVWAKTKTTVEEMLQWIKWGPYSTHQKSFQVGYVDRFRNHLQMVMFDRLDRDTVPTHRIQRFQYRDLVIWDKVDKVYLEPLVDQ